MLCVLRLIFSMISAFNFLSIFDLLFFRSIFVFQLEGKNGSNRKVEFSKKTNVTNLRYYSEIDKENEYRYAVHISYEKNRDF